MQCWVKNKTYKIKSPFRGSDGKIKSVKFDSQDSFFDWFFLNNSLDDHSNITDDFRVSGCWNWLLDDPSANDFTEILQRIEGAKLGISPTRSNFDDSPAILVEQLLWANAELNKARAEWQEKKNIG